MIRINGRTCSVVAALAFIGGAGPLRSQQVDTIRVLPDTVRKPSVDSAKVVDAKAAEAEKSANTAAAAKESLGGLGKMDAPIRLSASLSEKRLTVIAGNNAVRTFRVAVGTSSKPTPTGTFRVQKIVWNPSWVPPDEKWARGKTAQGPGEPGNPMKVAKIFFREPDYYIHGTAQVNSLGTADSHGCLRMSPDEVAELAQFLMENGGQPREEGWFSRVIHLRWKTHTVMLSAPVLLTVSE